MRAQTLAAAEAQKQALSEIEGLEKKLEEADRAGEAASNEAEALKKQLQTAQWARGDDEK